MSTKEPVAQRNCSTGSPQLGSGNAKKGPSGAGCRRCICKYKLSLSLSLSLYTLYIYIYMYKGGGERRIRCLQLTGSRREPFRPALAGESREQRVEGRQAGLAGPGGRPSGWQRGIVTYIYIYIERERRICMYTYTYVDMYM